MALNLSRNTKVFVSSVNGVHTAGGCAVAFDTITGGSGHAVGDIITCNDQVKVIVKAVNSGAVTEVYVPNNFRGHALSDNDDCTQSATTGSGTGFVIKAAGVTSTTTTDNSRAGLGLFKGNGADANTFRIGVLDGYSFSQGSESTDVQINEAGATPNRGSKRFNDSLPPAEWSFGTYVRPFKHGAASYRADGTYDCVENILWAALAGTALSDATGNGIATSTSTTTGALIDFLQSDAHELLKLNLFFALENTTYRLNEAQIGSAEIDFSIDGIAQITWSGNATTIDQVDEAWDDPSKYKIEAYDADGASLVHTSGTTDTYVEGYNYADTTGPSDADYLRNKLSTLYLDADAQGGGSSSGGLNNRLYDINITGGSISIENNVTYVTPETIGVVDKPIGSFTGSRTISGSLTMYLDTKTDGSNQLLTDLAGATDLVTNVFDMRLYMGVAGAVGSDGDAMDSGDFTAPGVEFNMPKAHLTVPVIEVSDLISVSVEFAAHGSDLLTGDEMKVKYLGATSHTEANKYGTTHRAMAA